MKVIHQRLAAIFVGAFCTTFSVMSIVLAPGDECEDLAESEQHWVEVCEGVGATTERGIPMASVAVAMWAVIIAFVSMRRFAG